MLPPEGPQIAYFSVKKIVFENTAKSPEDKGHKEVRLEQGTLFVRESFYGYSDILFGEDDLRLVQQLRRCGVAGRQLQGGLELALGVGPLGPVKEALAVGHVLAEDGPCAGRRGAARPRLHADEHVPGRLAEGRVEHVRREGTTCVGGGHRKSFSRRR